MKHKHTKDNEKRVYFMCKKCKPPVFNMAYCRKCKKLYCLDCKENE